MSRRPETYDYRADGLDFGPIPEDPRDPDSRYSVSDDGLQMLATVGQFRTIDEATTLSSLYGRDRSRYEQDRDSLIGQGLLERHDVMTRRGKMDVLVLTRRGRNYVDARNQNRTTRQALYAGLVKPREVVHDARIYAMYLAHKGRIEEAGGSIRRVVLDYELKKSIYKATAESWRLPEEERAHQLAQVAAEHELEIVDGKIPLPDLRVEYTTRHGSSEKIDLELVTEHYHRAHLAEKAAAGFTIWQESGRGTKPYDDHDITGDILDL